MFSITGKVNAIALDKCSKSGLVFDVSVHNCTRLVPLQSHVFSMQGLCLTFFVEMPPPFSKFGFSTKFCSSLNENILGYQYLVIESNVPCVSKGSNRRLQYYNMDIA